MTYCKAPFSFIHLFKQFTSLLASSIIHLYRDISIFRSVNARFRFVCTIELHLNEYITYVKGPISLLCHKWASVIAHKGRKEHKVDLRY